MPRRAEARYVAQLIDPKNSLQAFCRLVNREVFQEAQVAIETIRMGENFGAMEAFTSIVPKFSSVQPSVPEIDRQIAEYRRNGMAAVTHQLIVLFDCCMGDPDSSSDLELLRLR